MSNHPSISLLAKGKKAVIVGYRSSDIPIKIYEMGLLPGVELTMKQRLPFNGPICVQVNGNPNAVALRKAEAELILIDPVS